MYFYVRLNWSIYSFYNLCIFKSVTYIWKNQNVTNRYFKNLFLKFSDNYDSNIGIE